jgi:hypothetical protein
MTREKIMFTSFQPNENTSERIVFGDNSKGEILGLGKIAISNDNSISNVLLVNLLGYTLLFVSQLCEMSYNYLFMDKGVEVSRRMDSSIVFTGQLKGKLYLVDFSASRVEFKTCLVAKSSMCWLWHHRLAHVGIKNLTNLQRGEHILALTNISFEKDRICSAC